MPTVDPYRIAPESFVCSRPQPFTKVVSSADLGWTSLLVETMRGSTTAEAFETAATPDQLIVLMTRGDCSIESYSGGSWKKAVYTRGRGGMTAGGHTSRLRLNPHRSSSMETVRLYLPSMLFSGLEEEFRAAGRPFRRTNRDTLYFDDPFIYQAVRALVDAVSTGESNLYASTAAAHIATHVLSLSSGWATDARKQRFVDLPRARCERVADYMRHHYQYPVTLEELAAEAGVNRFHLGKLFKKRMGVTPHQYLVGLRMSAAAKLLCETEMTAQEVGLASGYRRASHFSAAFQHHYGQSPFAYRATQPGPLSKK